MGLESVRGWLAVVAVLAARRRTPGRPASQGFAPPKVRYANIGGYLLAYECAGTGRPTVILEAGYTASGISTYGPVIVPALARRTRVCTYDRAGDGLSDARRARSARSPGRLRPGSCIPC